LKDLHINQEPDELETLTSGFELEVRGGDIPIDYNLVDYDTGSRSKIAISKPVSKAES
jgi:hypothetical protein